MHRYLILFLSLFINLAPAHAKSLALVIGNGDYKNALSLSHPVNDAEAIAAVLRKLGFNVILRLDAKEKTMTKAVHDFGQRLRSGDIGLFYYSGYGLQYNNQNYLLPRWANIQNEPDIELEGFELNSVLQQMTYSNREGVNIVILDASRNNPYNAKRLEFKKGLAKTNSPKETLIAYAAAPNQVSYQNSEEANSFYTQYLLTALREKPYLSISKLFTEVKKQVEAEGKQVPWHTSSLTQPACFGKCGIVPASNVSQQLRECEKHFQANRLTSGKGGTALACYKEMLEIDRDQGLEGLKKIEKRYIQWIERALDRGQEDKAERYLASLHLVNPRAPTSLSELEAWQQSRRRESKVSTFVPRIHFTPNSYRAGQTFRDRLESGSLGPEMVWIPAGRFKMGDIQGVGNTDEQPVHEVSVEGFAMGRYEISFEEYDHFVKMTGHRKPKDSGWGRETRPVIWISWQEATLYAEWLSRQTGRYYRLPTEAEWEYAARAGTETSHWWGDEIDLDRANCAGSGNQQTAPVGSFEPNQFGLYDIVGNVWEWTCSAYEFKYLGGEQACVDKKKTNSRVLRGGSWFLNPKLCRVAIRNRGHSYSVYDNVGFRVVAVPTMSHVNE
ncbi:MAG: SUMF1/EgtB/PvdO family nonheme iron enzyme [Pseudomonadota bacterium]